MASYSCAHAACIFFLFCRVALASVEGTCAEMDTSHASVAAALLQVHQPRALAAKTADAHKSSSLLESGGVHRQASHKSRMHVIPFFAEHPTSKANPSLMEVAVAGRGGAAREILPPHLLEMGIDLFGGEDIVDYIVVNTQEKLIPYAEQNLVLRMVLGDGSEGKLKQEGSGLYGLGSLPQEGMVNMIDVGGNYGAVSIAAFLKYPKRMRAIAVEPIPSTYFLLRWNLYLNGVRELTLDDLADPTSTTPGVLAIHNAVSTDNWQVTDVCYSPPYTMSAHVCNCTEPHPEKQCAAVMGISLEQLFSFFDEQPISLLKIDCEGCEESALPALGRAMDSSPGRVQMLVGELHAPSPELEDIACRFHEGQYIVKVCLKDDEFVVKPLGCGMSGRPMCA